MKRFLYGMMVASLVIVGCGGDKKEAPAKIDDMSAMEMMTPEEMRAAEDAAMAQLAAILEGEGMNMAGDMGPDEFGDFDLADLTEEERMQLAAWEADAAAWAEEEMTAMAAAESDLPAVRFQEDSDEIQASLDDTITTAKAAVAAGKDIILQGHAFEAGDDDYRLELSEARADSVRLALVEAGIEEGRIHAAGYGDALPLDDNDMAPNNRVEVLFS